MVLEIPAVRFTTKWNTPSTSVKRHCTLACTHFQFHWR